MEYKRLTNKNLDEYNPEYDFCVGCEHFGEPNGCNRWNGTCGNYERFMETYNRLAELEDKIEQKTLVELPCKVGDIFYGIQENDFFKYRVDAIKITAKGVLLEAIYEMAFIFGVEAFLTREEAERRLKELQNG